jgi:hypothetical protein
MLIRLGEVPMLRYPYHWIPSVSSPEAARYGQCKHKRTSSVGCMEAVRNVIENYPVELCVAKGICIGDKTRAVASIDQ